MPWDERRVSLRVTRRIGAGSRKENRGGPVEMLEEEDTCEGA